MERASFWSYLRYFFLILVFPVNLGNIIWMLAFKPTSKLPGEVDWLWTVPFILLALLLLLGASLSIVWLWRFEVQKGTAKVIQTALDRGYREQNILPLAYALAPRSEKFIAQAAGAPVLAWDADRFELFINRPGAKAPYCVLSGARSDSTVELRRIALIHPIFDEHWGIQIAFRRLVPAQDGTTQTWKFVPYPHNYWSKMRKAAVAELVAKLNQNVATV